MVGGDAGGLHVHAEGTAPDHAPRELRRCEGPLQSFCRTASTLGPKLGALLFQLPPTFKKDSSVLRAFAELLPEGARAAFEFRHASWLDDETDILRASNLALCVADSEKMSTPVEVTADYAYFRLRDEGYQLSYGGRGCRGGGPFQEPRTCLPLTAHGP